MGYEESGAESHPKVQMEFDHAGRTYAISVDENQATPGIQVLRMNSVTRETDLVTGREVLVNWNQVGVVRINREVSPPQPM